MLQLIDEVATEIIITEFTHERAASAEVLFEQSHHEKKRMEKEWKKAIAAVLNNTKKEEVIVVTGSLYFLTIAREYLLTDICFTPNDK